MKTFIHKILTVIAVLAMCVGCETTEGTTDTSTQADGGSQDTSGETSGDVSNYNDVAEWKDVNIVNQGYVAIEAKSPDGKPVSFYYCNMCDCDAGGVPIDGPCKSFMENTTSYKYFGIANLGGGTPVWWSFRAVRENYLFVDWNVKVAGNPNKNTIVPYTYDWSGVGSWGYAVNGIYLDSEDGKKKNVSTNVKNDMVTMKVGTSDFEAIVTGHTIISTEATKLNGLDLTGTINEDGSVISYHWTSGSESGDGTLTRQ